MGHHFPLQMLLPGDLQKYMHILLIVSSLKTTEKQHLVQWFNQVTKSKKKWQGPGSWA